MSGDPAPAWMTREQQSALNELTFRWGSSYDIRFDGRLWSATHVASGDVMQADTSPLLKSQISHHYSGLAAGYIS